LEVSEYASGWYPCCEIITYKKEIPMEKYKNYEITIDLIDIFYLLRARLWIIILSGVLLASVVGLVSNRTTTPVYSSASKLYIVPKTTTTTSLADIQFGTQMTPDYMYLVKSRPVVEKVIENLKLNIAYEQLAGNISVYNPSDTRILVISVTCPDSFKAKEIADEIAVVSIERIASIMNTEKPTILEEGHESRFPINMNIKKNVILAGIIGPFTAAGIIIVIYLMNDTIKSIEDVEKYLGITALGIIPIENNKGNNIKVKKKRKKHRESA
jgi:capsular polysaccharide biosynthesis protein